MTDPNEIEALKASMRGALSTAGLLDALREKVERLDAHAGIPLEDLEELGRASLAHAVAAEALRGFVESMRTRRTAC